MDHVASTLAALADRVLHHPEMELQDRLARPFTLVPWGRPVPELLA